MVFLFISIVFTQTYDFSFLFLIFISSVLGILNYYSKKQLDNYKNFI